MSSAGDVNDDGFDDVLVAAGGDSEPGGALLYLGGSGGPSPATGLITVIGGSPASIVARTGDVNGDGFDDVLAGAPEYAGGLGSAQVFLGGPTGLASTPAVELVNPEAWGWFGCSVD